MEELRRYYRDIWAIDFEFYAPPGERPLPLCAVAHEMLSGRRHIAWLEGTTPAPWWGPGPETLTVTYYGSAEMTCYLALGWPFPARMLDLYPEFKALTCGRTVPHGHGLLGALAYFGLDGLAAAEKADRRQLAQRGGPYTAAEREALLTYCQTDVDALARLVPAMLPHLDLPRALLSGRYMQAAARMEWTGVPCDVGILDELRTQWDVLRHRLARDVNRTCGVFVPTGTTLDPQSRAGAAVLATAAARRLDPYHLAVAVDYVWRETRLLSQETLTARREARVRTGLTEVRIARWEQEGHDASSWPGLGEMAAALVEELPALGLGAWEAGGWGDAPPEYGDQLWELLRDGVDRLPQRHDPQVLSRAADLVERDPEGEAWEGPLTFSTQRFEQYLARHDLPWPRLASGALQALADTPTLVLKVQRGTRHAYDVPGMAELLRCYAGLHVQVYIEESQPMPGQGTRSMFTVGYGYGLWIGVLTTLQLPYTAVRPAVWKRSMGLSKDKEGARLRAQQLYPGADLRRKRDHGRAEALLLASYGTQRYHQEPASHH